MIKEDKDTPKILSKNLFPVVGIGASAGGLDAFKKFINAIPDNSGMAYILVQHLHPEHSSALPEILQRETNIPVHEIKDNVEVHPDNIYIIPANKMLVATDGILQLSPRSAKDLKNLPINFFFSSLADVHRNHAIGIVLSGTGSDGTIGLKEIKSQGGITFAQEVSSAAYEGMPQNAIDAEVVDFILPPEKMPQQLLELKGTYNKLPLQNVDASKQFTEEVSYKKICVLLKVRHGVDFTYYKQTTIRRRMLRRMVVTKQENITDYLKYLKENHTEQDTLFQDILIPVTSFFRDPEVFENLCEKVFPELIKNKTKVTGTNRSPLRIWIAACSTGEEAYSMAICLHEYLSHSVSNIKIQIFATDISEKAITKARTALYPKRELEGVSDVRLHQFFTKTDGHYQVKKIIRDMCVFACHNFLKDPPFAKMDFISCRNVLIYMEPFLQQKAFTYFHYALNERGYLLLGKSETTGNSSELFNTLGKKEKLYSRKSVPGRFMNMASDRREETIKDNDYAVRSNERRKDDFQKNADDILLSKYTPAGVIVNEQFDIVQFRGSTGDFLEPSPGKASLNLLKMAREGLSFELRNALYKSKTTREPFIKEGIPINYGKKIITIEVMPLLNTEDLYFLILFKEVSGIRYQVTGIGDQQSTVSDQQSGIGNEQSASSKSNKEKDNRIQQLEKNLLQAREDMRSITEEQEAANEELQSANEELLSGSEELQSLNEELETSKEELQSTNEELITVNQELYDRNEQFNTARLYSEAIVTTMHEPLLVLGHDFRIKSANKAFYKIFEIAEEETVGKILFDLQNQGWNIPGLQTELVTIQKGKERFLEWELTYTFPVVGERTICFKAQPFQKENGEHWILLALEDITERKLRAQNQNLLSTIVDNSNDGIMSKNLDGTLTSWNKSAEQIFGYTSEEMIGKNILTIIPPELHQEEAMIINKIKKGESIPHFNTVRMTKDGIRINVSLSISPIKDAEGNVVGASKISRDITEQIIARKIIESAERRYNMMVMQSPFGFALLKGKDMLVTLTNDSMKEIWGKGKDIEGRPLIDLLPELEGQGFIELLETVYTTGKPYFAYETLARLTRKGKLEDAYFNFVYQPYYEIDETISGVVIIAIETTPQAILSKKIKISEARYQNLITSSPSGILTLTGKDLIITSANNAALEILGKGNDVMAKPYFTVMPELVEQGYPEVFEKVYTTGISFNAVETLVNILQNGIMTSRYYNFLLYPNRNINDEIDGICIIASEVTTQALFNKKIKQSEERFRQLTELMPEKISNLDAEGKVIYVNKNWLEYTGMSFDQLRDFGYHSIIHPEELEEFQKQFQDAAKMETDLEMEMRFINKDGVYKWHLNRATPVKDENGKVIMWIGATTDINDQKNKEQAKDEFIGIASHEMKTPLTTAKAYIQLLQRSLENTKGEDLFFAHKASESIDRLNSLIGELLDVSKIKSGELPLNITTFNFNDMATSAIESIQYTSPAHKIILSGEIAELVTGDKERMQQVVINLLSNAVKYSPMADKVYMQILKENGDIKVSVRDEGIGIQKESSTKIFERYYREEGRARQFQGLGIGLSISHEIIKRHKGKIWVESEPDKGSIFYFTIPV